MTVEEVTKIMSNIRSIYEPRMDPSSNYFVVVPVDTGGFNEKVFDSERSPSTSSG